MNAEQVRQLAEMNRERRIGSREQYQRRETYEAIWTFYQNSERESGG